MKRAAIFAFYDNEGVVDDYVLYLLNGIHPYIDRLICVVNGQLKKEEAEKLGVCCDEILFRDNEGFDVTAYKYGTEILLDRLEKWDEVLYFNATVYGPVCSFSNVFTKMDGKNVDFWGMTRHTYTAKHHVEGSGLDYIPEHIQSYFFAVRKKMFYSRDFIDYWHSMERIQAYEDAVIKHELVFTNYFEKRGYSWSSYIEPTTDDLMYPYVLMTNPVKLIEQQGCPVIKRKCFLHTVEDQPLVPMMGTANELFQYVKKNTEYDVGLIIDNLLRTERVISYEQALYSIYRIEECTEKIPDTESITAFIRIDNTDYLDCFLELLEKGIRSIVFLCSTKEVLNEVTSRCEEERVTGFKDSPETLFNLLEKEAATYSLISSCTFRKGKKVKSSSPEYILEIEEVYKTKELMTKKVVSILKKDPYVKVCVPTYSRFNATKPKKPSKEHQNLEIDLTAVFGASNTFLAKTKHIVPALKEYAKHTQSFYGTIDSFPAYCAKFNGGLVGEITDKEIEKSYYLTMLPLLQDMGYQGVLIGRYDHARAFMYNFLTEKSVKERMWFLALALLPFKRKKLFEEYKDRLQEWLDYVKEENNQ